MTKTPKSPEQLRVDSLIETIQQHPTDVLEAERRLYSTKWFDYRFMSSEELNRLFTKTYQQVYRRKFAAEVDMQFAKNVSGVHVLTMRKSQRERSQLVIARQRADEFGLPYPVYIEAAFEFALKRGDNRNRLPRPNQLHGNDKSAPWFRKYVMEKWSEHVAAGLARVEHPSYRIENYRGIPAQDDFRQFVLQYVQDVRMPLHRAIQIFTYDRKQVPADLFRSIATEEIFDRAMAIVENDHKELPVDDIVDVPQLSTNRWPTCFGMHYTLDEFSPECSSCPQMKGCKKLGDHVLREASVRSGIADPAGDYKRRNDRERQQRCRAKKRIQKDDMHSRTLPHTPD